jgi:putative phosphoribosyl transferase
MCNVTRGVFVMFRNREEAGMRLAAELRTYKGSDVVVLALPRGGVPVAYEVARELEAPLDLVIVRKIGAPFQPELAVAAVVDGEKPELVVNHDVVEMLGITDAYLREEAGRELDEIERRRRAYVGDREHVPVEGKTVIVIDDGIATGASVRAALRAARRRGPSWLVLAIPVAPPSRVDALRVEVDDLVCLATPEMFFAIGQFYSDFHQVSDEDVRELLARAKPGGAEVGGAANP